MNEGYGVHESIADTKQDVDGDVDSVVVEQGDQGLVLAIAKEDGHKEDKAAAHDGDGAPALAPRLQTFRFLRKIENWKKIYRNLESIHLFKTYLCSHAGCKFRFCIIKQVFFFALKKMKKGTIEKLTNIRKRLSSLPQRSLRLKTRKVAVGWKKTSLHCPGGAMDDTYCWGAGNTAIVISMFRPEATLEGQTCVIWKKKRYNA